MMDKERRGSMWNDGGRIIEGKEEIKKRQKD